MKASERRREVRVKREAARSASHAQGEGEGDAKCESRFGGGAHRYSREEALVISATGCIFRLPRESLS